MMWKGSYRLRFSVDHLCFTGSIDDIVLMVVDVMVFSSGFCPGRLLIIGSWDDTSCLRNASRKCVRRIFEVCRQRTGERHVPSSQSYASMIEHQGSGRLYSLRKQPLHPRTLWLRVLLTRWDWLGDFCNTYVIHFLSALCCKPVMDVFLNSNGPY